MIFAMVGMELYPFDRLARAIDELAGAGALGEEVFLQLGSCKYEPRNVRFQRYISFGEVCENIQRASVVVTHAGAGSTLVCIEHGKHPVVVPRHAALNEHVDEHQVKFAERLAQGGLATLVDDLAQLSSAIAAARQRSGQAAGSDATAELTGWLEQFWGELASRRGRGGSRHG